MQFFLLLLTFCDFRIGEIVYFRIYIFQMKCILEIKRIIKQHSSARQSDVGDN